MKVLHVIHKLNAGGIETWLKDLAVHNELDKSHELFVSTQTKERAFYDDSIRCLGNTRLIKMEKPGRFFSYTKELYSFMVKENFDVVHSHTGLFSGWIVFVAYLARVRLRVVHVHTDKLNLASRVRKVYSFLMKKLMCVFSTHKVAVSENASFQFFGRENKVFIIPCGINFVEAPHFVSRSDFGFNKNDIVLCHVGRFNRVKNHGFLIEMAASLPCNYKFLLIGDGVELNSIKKIVNEKCLQDRVVFLGQRSDVPSILKHVADIFLLPSLFEGFGLAAVEAQHYGVITLVSNNVPKTVEISNYCYFLPISDHLDWSRLIIKHSNQNSAGKICDKSAYSISDNALKIDDVYKSSGGL